MFGLAVGNLELDALTASVFVFSTLIFLGSFIYISRTNDMIGALKSLLPRRKGRKPLPGPDDPFENEFDR